MYWMFTPCLLYMCSGVWARSLELLKKRERACSAWTATVLQCMLGLVSIDSILKRYFQNSQEKSNYVKSTDVE